MDRNYRCRIGELDIVASDGRVLVVAEVRMRSSDRYGGAAASVTWRKRQRIVRATRHLLAMQPALAALPVRFDVLLADGAEGRWNGSAAPSMPHRNCSHHGKHGDGAGERAT